MESLPTLYHRARTGAIHSWAVWVDGSTIFSEHGQVDGQKIISTRQAEPKNVGRKNATTAEQQAEIEAKAMHKYKLDRKYSLTPEDAKEDVLLPMLAHPFEKYAKKIAYPIDVQPKLDGLRALARWDGDKIVLVSRAGKLWEATDHLNQQLHQIMPKGAVLDGEIYLHGKPLQWISSRAKKRQEGTEQLEFHVYDAPEVEGDDSLSWVARRGALDKLLEESTPWASHIRFVTTNLASSYEAVMAYHDVYVGMGYEGLIVRMLDGKYEYGHRSPSLLKVKWFSDAEFKIVGHTQGTGIETGLVVWICKNDVNDLTFETRPRGSHAERKQLFDTAESYYGQKLTVRFLGRNDSQIPHHAIGHAIRLPEDM